MAGNRAELQLKLEEVLGSENVYFQPPATIKLVYPCIIYKRDEHKEFFADDRLYMGMKRYSVTIIDKNPDSPIPDRLMGLRYCSFSASFRTDNLNHDVYSLYF